MTTPEERLKRWRLILGGGEADGTGAPLSGLEQGMDRALEGLYDSDRKAGLGSSSPSVARWLGDIRAYFPAPVVQVMQKDALERLNLRRLLLEPELLDAIVPDVNLVANLLALKNVLPARSKDTARAVVRKVVEQLERRLSQKLRQAVTGSLQRAARTRRPRPSEMDWNRTIRLNLKHYQPDYATIIPVSRSGFARKRSMLRDVILCLDQSGSMAGSLVYAGVFAAALASLRSIRTRLVAFDTAIADLSEQLQDPVDVLFGLQLGGGTDINRALAYAQGLVQRPSETILVLISDLFEGGDREALLLRAAALVRAGVTVVCLLALNDRGAPAYDHDNARALAGLGIATFACTPDQFPALMAAAIQKQDLQHWAAREGIITQRGEAIE